MKVEWYYKWNVTDNSRTTGLITTVITSTEWMYFDEKKVLIRVNNDAINVRKLRIK